MINLNLRVLGTQLLELRLGRERGERTDEWWPCYQDGRFDRQHAGGETADGEEESQPHEWTGCQFAITADAQEADQDAESSVSTPGSKPSPRLGLHHPADQRRPTRARARSPARREP